MLLKFKLTPKRDHTNTQTSKQELECFLLCQGCRAFPFINVRFSVSAGGGVGGGGGGRGGTRPILGYRQERMISLGIGEQ